MSDPRRRSSWPSVEVHVVDADTSLETLYSLVISYIWAAEGASARGDHFASARLFLVVSLVEEQIARRRPADSEEGAIARRGAVWAAFSAGLITRAGHLAEIYGFDDAAVSELRTVVGGNREKE